MLTSLLWLGASALAAPPTLAVLPLTPEAGVAESTTRLLTDVLLQELQNTRAFSRVVSAREMENVLGLEKQRQLLSCTDGSCIAEIANALGADFMLTGAVGRVGDTLLLSLKLLNARNAALEATRSVRADHASDAALIDAMPAAVEQLLTDAHLSFTARAATSEKAAGGRTPIFLAASLAGFAGAGAGAVLGVVALLGGVLAVVLPKLVYVATPGLPWQARLAVMPGGGLAGMGVGGLLLTVGLLLSAGGAGLLVAHLVTG